MFLCGGFEISTHLQSAGTVMETFLMDQAGSLNEDMLSTYQIVIYLGLFLATARIYKMSVWHSQNMYYELKWSCGFSFQTVQKSSFVGAASVLFMVLFIAEKNYISGEWNTRDSNYYNYIQNTTWHTGHKKIGFIFK